MPDSGIAYSFLTPPAGANITTFNCSGDSCASPGQFVQIFLPGQTSPQQLATYNFTTGSTTNPLTPASVQVVPGSTVFLNTGRQFYAGFNYFFDSGQRLRRLSMGEQLARRRLRQRHADRGIAGQRHAAVLELHHSHLPGGRHHAVVDGYGRARELRVRSRQARDRRRRHLAHGRSNTYTGGTTVTGGSLSLGPGSTLPYAGALTVNGGSFNLNGNTQLLGSLGGSGGTVNLGNGLLVLNSAQSNTLGSSLSGNGTFTVQGGGSLNLTGNSSGFTGFTVVSNASLNVGGSLGGSVFVLPGSALGGTGSVGHLFNSGVVATRQLDRHDDRRRQLHADAAAATYMTEVAGAGLERPHQCRRHGRRSADRCS